MNEIKCIAIHADVGFATFDDRLYRVGTLLRRPSKGGRRNEYARIVEFDTDRVWLTRGRRGGGKRFWFPIFYLDTTNPSWWQPLTPERVKYRRNSKGTREVLAIRDK